MATIFVVPNPDLQMQVGPWAQSVFVVPNPDLQMQVGPWAQSVFRIGTSYCGQADGTETEQGIVLTNADLRGP